MTLWQWINNNFPPYAEEKLINQEVEQIQETLNKFKQPIPNDFIKVETKGKNYMCSTEGWKEPVCERFGFLAENGWIQLDIPHAIMERLELEKGREISYPIHISKEVLEKETSFGGKTIENEEEIFIERPFTIKNLEKDLTKLSQHIRKLGKEKGDRTKIITQKDNKIEKLNKRIKELEADLENSQREKKQVGKLLERYSNQTELLLKADEIVKILDKIKKGLHDIRNITDNNEFNARINLIGVSPPYVYTSMPMFSITKPLTDLIAEYRDEKLWWNRWIKETVNASGNPIAGMKNGRLRDFIRNKKVETREITLFSPYYLISTAKLKPSESSPEATKKAIELIKTIHDYYSQQKKLN